MKCTALIVFCLFCIFSAKGQTVSLNFDSLYIISIDNNTLTSYNWKKCSTNSNDTIIVLSERNFICDKESSFNLNRIYLYVENDLSMRLNVNDIYVDGELMFPRRYAVYMLTCEENDPTLPHN